MISFTFVHTCSCCAVFREALSVAADGQPSMDVVVQALLLEINKEKFSYRLAAFTCLADILEKHELDYYSKVSSVILPIIEKVRRSLGGRISLWCIDYEGFELETLWKVCLIVSC